MRTRVVLALLGLASLGACSGVATPPGFNTDGGSGSGGSGGGGGNGSGGSGSGGSGSGVNFGGSGGGSGGSSGGDAGFVCAPNPLNYDIPGNNCDDDDDGKVDNVILCDSAVPTGSGAGTGTDILNAMEVCHAADATHWGIVSSSLTYGHSATAVGDGNFNYQHGILNTFGSVTVPQQGKALAVLSSGTADINDTQDSPPYFKGPKTGMQLTTLGDVPTGFPKQTLGCPALSLGVFDVVDLKTQIKVPANAKGIQFDFDFHSGEWPDYVCSSFNDSFIAYLTSKAFNGGAPDNISFDSKGDPVSVNSGFFGVCSPAGATTGCSGTPGTAACTLGSGALAGTGFDDLTKQWCGQPSSGGGATGWLTSTAPVQPGETITLEFIIWDTGDPQYDSSVLLDDITWQPQEVPATPVTQPTPAPK